MNHLIKLELIEQPQLPLEADCLSPDRLAELTLEDIYGLKLLYGNQEVHVGQFFRGEITEQAGEDTLYLIGDLSRVKRIGQRMAAGRLIIDGDAGFHTGAEMSGGSMCVNGNAGDWLGAHMAGGSIVVSGNAGHWPGGAYRGKTQGMNGGSIFIHGNAGRMVGTKMRGGLIVVCGNSQEFAGYEMKAGTILLGAECGRHIGSGMLRGTIILMQTHQLLPTFYYNCEYKPTFWPLLAGFIKSQGVELRDTEGLFGRYSGEALTGSKGEVLICRK